MTNVKGVRTSGLLGSDLHGPVHTALPVPMKTQMTLGERIKSRRRRKGLSQEKLGEAIQLSTAAISYFENSKRTPGVKTLTKLCDTLGCTPNDLLGY